MTCYVPEYLNATLTDQNEKRPYSGNPYPPTLKSRPVHLPRFPVAEFRVAEVRRSRSKVAWFQEMGVLGKHRMALRGNADLFTHLTVSSPSPIDRDVERATHKAARILSTLHRVEPTSGWPLSYPEGWALLLQLCRQHCLVGGRCGH